MAQSERESPTILSEEILAQQGSYKRVRRFLSGHHPERGKLTEGWSGPETIEETDAIVPVAVITVLPDNEVIFDAKKEKDKRHFDNLAHFSGYFHGKYFQDGVCLSRNKRHE